MTSNTMDNSSKPLPTNLALDDPRRVIFGLCFVQNPGPWWVPPGLESTQGPGAKPIYYRSPFFGADREYGPDEGWQTFQNRRGRRLARRSKHRDDSDYYDFEDN
jgi:hypothetical protein